MILKEDAKTLPTEQSLASVKEYGSVHMAAVDNGNEEEVFVAAGDADAARLARASQPMPPEDEHRDPAAKARAEVPEDIAEACGANGITAAFALVLDAFLELEEDDQGAVRKPGDTRLT